ncbi:MAG: DNA repair protein RecO [Peptococcaceae bacterium]|nr:DNA repair protein RecO [Peptococcaceae bacterium]
MSSYKADALVIRSREYKEADRLITLYSREYGKISAVAKGVRKATSKQRGGVQLYTYADFMLYKGRSLDTVQQAHPREVFLYLWDDYERACGAACMAELLDAATPDGEPDERAFLLSLKFLFMLEMLDPAVAVTAYGVRLMACLGELGQVESDEKGSLGAMTEGTRNVLRQLQVMPWERMERLRLSVAQHGEMFRVLRVFCENKAERKLSAWRSFEEVNKAWQRC